MKSEKREHEIDLDALSAWYDGDAAGVNAAPPAGSEAEARLAAYRAITAAIAALPQPDVHPAFRTRVMAALREEEARPARSRFAWPWAGAAAGVVLVLAAAVLWRTMPSEQPPAANPAVAEAPAMTDSIYLRAVELPESAYAAIAPEPGIQNAIAALDDETTAEMAAMGAAVEAMGAVADVRSDVGELLYTLDAEQEEQLKHMLLASVSEDWSL